MRGALPATQQFYAEISSQFVPASSSGGNLPSAAVNTTSSSIKAAATAASALDAHVSQAVNGITTGALSAMVEGEKPAMVVTANVRAKMENQGVTNKTVAPFAPPQSEEEAQYGAPQPTIQVVGSNLLKCNFGGGYAQTSSVQYGSNPHQGSESISSPLLQFGSRSTTKIPKSVHIATSVAASFDAVARAIDERYNRASEERSPRHPHLVVDQQEERDGQQPRAARRKLLELTAVTNSPSYSPSSAPIAPSRPPTIAPTVRPSLSHTPSLRPSPEPSRIPTAAPTNVVPIPEYYVTLPLTGKQKFNVTQYRLSKGSRSLSNYSIPACTLYLGGKYVPCGACNISSITMVNVTYGCYDITYLCPVPKAAITTATSAATVRRLEMYDEPDDYHRNGGGTMDVGGPLEEDEMDMSLDGLGLNSHSYLTRDLLGYSQSSIDVMKDSFVTGNSSMQGWNDKNVSLLWSNHLSEIYRQLELGQLGARNRLLRGGGVGGKSGGGVGSTTKSAGHDDLISHTFNTSATDDHSDDAPKADDTFTVNTDIQVNQFGSIAEAILGELQTVLSLDLSHIDLAKAAPVLAFVTTLTAIWLLGSLFFLRWDKADRHRLVYLREYHVKAAYKLIKEDIHKGGSGVIEEHNIRKMVLGGAMDLQAQINRTLNSLRTSFSPKEYFNPHKRNTVYAGTTHYTRVIMYHNIPS